MLLFRIILFIFIYFEIILRLITCRSPSIAESTAMSILMHGSDYR